MRGFLVIMGVVFVSAMILAPRGVGASAPEDDLPEGEGKKILLIACTSCHELDEVTKFKGYYTRAQWRDLVVTMQEYGAPVEARQIEVLTDYLTLHLGRK